MHEHKQDVDPSLLLIPIEPVARRPVQPIQPQQAKQPRRLFPFLLIGIAAFLGLGGLIAVVALVARLGDFQSKEVFVTAQEDAGRLRQESARVFAAFDALNPPHAHLSAERKQEWDAIDALFQRVAQYAAEESHAEFRKLIDGDRLLKRVELTGQVGRWSYLERKITRGQIIASSEADAFWGTLLVAGIVAPADDVHTRVVYAYAWHPQTQDEIEIRFWIGRDGDTWKIYDWEQLDLGLSESREWALYIKYGNTRQLEGFQTWSSIIAEADAHSEQGENEAAKEKLRRSEEPAIPFEFEGFRNLLTGYRWAALGDYTEAERCYRNIQRPEDTPGAYYGLMVCNRGKNPQQALHFAQLYEDAVGPTPNLMREKAELLKELGLKSKAAEEWRKLLRILPDDSAALTEYFCSLPEDDKSAFVQHLERLEDPIATAVGIAPGVGYRDYRGLLSLVDYLTHRAPNAAGTHYVAGFAKYLDGQHADAARLYQTAFQAETDEIKRLTYINSYLAAMAAAGQILSAIDHVPEPKEALESLFYSYDEAEIELTEDEYRQLVALYRKYLPNDAASFYREGLLALEQERFDEAERLLRDAVALRAPNNADNAEEEEDYERDAMASSLASALYRGGKLREAYESAGDRHQRFLHLVRLATYDERWDDLRQLIDWHRASEPDDPKIAYAAGELAAHQKQWDQAIQLLRQAAEAAPEYEGWYIKRRLVDVAIDSDQWMDYYTSSDDRAEAFTALADRLVANQNWAALDTLVAQHRRHAPDDARIAKQQADAAWEQQDDAAFIRAAEELLTHKDDLPIHQFERGRLQTRLVSALLRTNQSERAQRLAEKKQQEEGDGFLLAVVHAAKGNVNLAHRTALAAARRDDSASRLYMNESAAHHFLGADYRELHEEFPVELPYQPAPAMAVLLYESERTLQAAEVSAALRELGVAAAVEPLTVLRKKNVRAFAVPTSGGSIWIAAGGEKFNDNWQLDDKHSPLASQLANSNGWLAVGTAAWTDRDRRRNEALARGLASRLASDSAVAFSTRGRESWAGFTLRPFDAATFAAWTATGELQSADAGISVSEKDTSRIATNRDFHQALRTAARAFEAAPNGRLEVVATTSANPSLDPLRMQVKAVRRSYGRLQFDGILQNRSALLPQLREGLSMRFTEDEVQAWRLNQEPPVYRP